MDQSVFMGRDATLSRERQVLLKRSNILRWHIPIERRMALQCLTLFFYIGTLNNVNVKEEVRSGSSVGMRMHLNNS